ncbi:MAG: hypothetical protein OJF50_004207 [Nitrospira sp.]|jgi:hypothetical protein|nr:hypothetical protein [Nitrospira sp.]
MCVHIKTSSLTNRPDLFLRHMQDDELVLEGFKGRRGLLEPVGAEPPTLPFATLEKYANEWIEAMGSKFHQPSDCGCVVHGDYILEFRSNIVSTSKVDPAQSQASARSFVLKPLERNGPIVKKPHSQNDLWRGWNGRRELTNASIY